MAFISCINSFEKHKEYPVAFTGKVKVPLKNIPTDYEKNLAQLETAEFVTANCACSREKRLKLTNGFDEAFTLAWREDSDLHFKFLEANIPVVYVEEAVVVHPPRKVAWHMALREERKNIFNPLLYKKHPQLYLQKIKTKPPLQYYLMILCMAACFHFFINEPCKACNFIFIALVDSVIAIHL